MRTEFTAIYETNHNGGFLARIAEMPKLQAKAKTLEAARSQLTEKLRRNLESARTQALANASRKARIETICIQTRKPGRGRQAAYRSPVRKADRSSARPELDLLQLLLEHGLIDAIPPLDRLDDNFEPIRIEGRPISEELIEDRR